MLNGVKKSFYIFLTSLLGLLLFLMLDRVAVFIYLYLIAGGYVNVASFNYYDFLALDYCGVVMVTLLGSWYGIWLGLYWYEKVYEEKSHGGIIDHISRNYFFPAKPAQYGSKLSAVKQRLEKDLWQLEDLAKNSVSEIQNPKPIKRKIVRKRAPKKLNSLK